ncbi:ion channel [Mucilaginibacter myungsuensis]|uniref:Ion transporter n=1 Tax=Mucilaginibacter myungsuensis TaxID=649104 RepID=A0A929KUN8_9SPHI|nr:ion channel [Mucilaginibacter myungsuensis]MBE9660748.1 ion transporter [Mucilaginibacter myungsuensis]MDN3600793.1 ion channel [Mucilaginibacter myungsuensis]
MAFKHSKSIDPTDDLGFGSQPVIRNQPLLNRDGTVNVRRKGVSLLNTADYYHNLIQMSWGKFWVVILSGYMVVNLIFAGVYTLVGHDSLYGADGSTDTDHFLNAFFFSAQTMSTVGYGHISPKGTLANTIAALESMLGLLAFALATGLLYGRFSRPSAKISYSKNILVSPYRDNGKGLMFRLANLRKNVLIDLNIEVIFSYNEDVDGKPVRRFFPLELERRQVTLLTLSWTVVHPLDGNSPLRDMTLAELERTGASFSILLKAFDDTFSQTVHSRAAYYHNDIVWDAKFKQAFDRDEDGTIVLDLSGIDRYELV